MLDFFRKFYSSPLGKVITIIVAALFVIGFSFMPYIIGTVSVPSEDAAVVDGSKISLGALERYYGRLEGEYMKLYKNKLTEREIKALNLPETALSSLIADRVLELKSPVFGINVSDGFIARRIASYPVFQENGSFKDSLFKSVLLQNHLTPADFENSLRRQITRSYIRNIIMESFSMPREQFINDFKINNKSVSFEIAVFKSKDDASNFLRAALLNPGSFKSSAGKNQAALRTVPLYSEAGLIKSSFLNDYGISYDAVQGIFSSPPGSVVGQVFPAKEGFMVIKIQRVYFPRYVGSKIKSEPYVLKEEQKFLYGYVEYLENKSSIKINKKALRSFSS